MYYVQVNRDAISHPLEYESEHQGVAKALLKAVSRSALDGRDRSVIRALGDRTAMYLCEADTKVDEEDATFPVIVHTEALLVGENA